MTRVFGSDHRYGLEWGMWELGISLQKALRHETSTRHTENVRELDGRVGKRPV